MRAAVANDREDLTRCFNAIRWAQFNVPTAPNEGLLRLEAYVQARLNLPRCTFCLGFGHEPASCSSRINVDRAATKLGMKFWWGQIKYGAFFKHWLLTPANKDSYVLDKLSKACAQKRAKR